MPGKNVLKSYCENTIYHLYNRGVDKRNIFQDGRDYKTFLFLLRKYLSPPPSNKPFSKKYKLFKEISLLSFCLMPNHFHLLVKQVTKNAITELIRRVCTNYSMFFNKRYARNGTLFESRYKAVIVGSEEQLLHLSRYIHLNPKLAKICKTANYSYSSYQYLIGRKKSKWVKPEIILNYFNKDKKGFSYKEFISEYEKEDILLDKKLLLEKA